ncbi:MAG: hypothetical protein Kow0029_14790 [Candidatus Rifleibacteriota bacterium]
MEPADFAVAIEEVMSEECTRYECVYEDEDEIARIWNFVIDDSISGYIAVEDNEDSLGIQTVSIGLHLKDVTELSRDEIVNLFAANAEFINAGLSIIHIPVPADNEESEDYDDAEDSTEEEPETEIRELLIIQTRTPFEAFDPEEFRSYIDNLVFQYQIILGEEEPDAKDDIIDDLDLMLEENEPQENEQTKLKGKRNGRRSGNS